MALWFRFPISLYEPTLQNRWFQVVFNIRGDRWAKIRFQLTKTTRILIEKDSFASVDKNKNKTWPSKTHQDSWGLGQEKRNRKISLSNSPRLAIIGKWRSGRILVRHMEQKMYYLLSRGIYEERLPIEVYRWVQHSFKCVDKGCSKGGVSEMWERC
jgi:hypothetical protein